MKYGHPSYQSVHPKPTELYNQSNYDYTYWVALTLRAPEVSQPSCLHTTFMSAAVVVVFLAQACRNGWSEEVLVSNLP